MVFLFDSVTIVLAVLLGVTVVLIFILSFIFWKSRRQVEYGIKITNVKKVHPYPRDKVPRVLIIKTIY